MADVYNVAGSTIWIGDTITVPMNGDLDAADFASQNWKEISGWQTAGTIGDTAQITTTTLISSGRDRKTKGSRNAGTMDNTFVPDGTDPGQLALLAAERGCDNYAFRIIWSAGCERSSTVTIAGDDVTWPAHGLANGSSVKFESTGSLPTGLTAGTVYYVVDSAADTFAVAATPGGAAITTTGAGTGVQTAIATPSGRTQLFGALVAGATYQGGDANAAQMFSSTLEVNSNIVQI